MKNKLEKVIAFHPFLSRTLGDVESALYYQQLFYWKDKGVREDGFIYKTKNEIEEETTLTPKQQDRIRNKLVKMGWLETKLLKHNGAPTLHYRVNYDITLNLDFVKRDNGLCPKVIMDYDQRSHSSYTENTTDTIPLEKGIIPNLPDVSKLEKKTVKETPLQNTPTLLLQEWNTYRPTNEPCRNIKVKVLLFKPCLRITPDLAEAWKKLEKAGYTIDDAKIAFANYAKEIKQRPPGGTDDTERYARHRFSLYDFLNQKNGFRKFINR